MTYKVRIKFRGKGDPVTSGEVTVSLDRETIAAAVSDAEALIVKAFGPVVCEETYASKTGWTP